MSHVFILLGLLLNVLLVIHGKEISIGSAVGKRDDNVEPVDRLQDLEAEEDSSVKYQEIITIPVRVKKQDAGRNRRSFDDLEAQEDNQDERLDRSKRTPESWRSPRNYQFVTRTSRQENRPSPRSARLIESGGRFYDERNQYTDYIRSPPRVRDTRRNNFPNRRIIYYATLPEPTRRPDYDQFMRDYEREEYDRQYSYDRYYNNPSYNQDYDRYNDYYPNRYDQSFNRPHEQHYNRPHDHNYNRPPDSNYNRPQEQDYNRPIYPGYPSVGDNEITRVTSSIIDVTNKDDLKDREKEDPGLSKFVIIDREPPYLKDVYNFLSSYKPSNEDKYNQFLAQYTREETTERNTKKPPRKQMNVPIPAVQLTVFKGKPLDIRPLDLSVETSSNTSNKDRPSTTHKPTTLNPIQQFERSFKY